MSRSFILRAGLRTVINKPASCLLYLAGILVLALACLLPALCWAEDKSGVSPNTISLPSGPGSIKGLGEAFQPTLNTGTGKYAIKLQLPPGTGGHAPQLSLSYDGGSSRPCPGHPPTGTSAPNRHGWTWAWQLRAASFCRYP
ncbi:hypothetical protein H8E77_28850 [bacterium]|nr:hypothetical protein [bacterium]